jgi:hypothetical protein
MSRCIVAMLAVAFFLTGLFSAASAEDMEVLGVTFPGEKIIAGKTLKLNGVAYRFNVGDKAPKNIRKGLLGR